MKGFHVSAIDQLDQSLKFILNEDNYEEQQKLEIYGPSKTIVARQPSGNKEERNIKYEAILDLELVKLIEVFVPDEIYHLG